MHTTLALLALGIRLTTASTISVLTNTQVLEFITELNNGQPPLGPQGGCSGGRIQDAQQSYNDGITLANLAVGALDADPIVSQFNNMFHLLFDSASQGPADPGEVAGLYQEIADTDGPQTDSTPEDIILHCEDKLFDELVDKGIHPGFPDPGDPCNDPDTNAYSFSVTGFDNDDDNDRFGALIGSHVVLCVSFFQLPSLAAIPAQQVGSDMIGDDDANAGLENTRPGIMLHELGHVVLGLTGDQEDYGIINAVKLAEEEAPSGTITRGQENADTFNLFAITLIDQANDFDWSGQGENDPGIAADPGDDGGAGDTPPDSPAPSSSAAP